MQVVVLQCINKLDVVDIIRSQPVNTSAQDSEYNENKANI